MTVQHQSIGSQLSIIHVERLMEWRVLQHFRTYDSVKETNRLQLRIMNHYQTCPEKVERSNASDWSIVYWRPE